MLIMAFRIALRALARNKLRSFLTMLGIIIGVGAVIAMVAIGEGAKKRVQEQIASLGTNLLVILPGTVTLGGARSVSGGRQSLIAADATAMMKYVLGVTYSQQIIVAAVSAATTQEANAQIALLLRQRHRIRPGNDDDFNIRYLSDIAEAASNSATVMALLLGSIASVSLIVGGIGIMNIMLVSVTERTREIGIRMAVGARGRDIMLQFIVEAVVMAASGGVIGILVGIGSSNLIKYLAELPTLIRPEIIAISFLVSGTVGVFFGFYPARKASQLDPIDALRYE